MNNFRNGLLSILTNSFKLVYIYIYIYQASFDGDWQRFYRFKLEVKKALNVGTVDAAFWPQGT